MKVILPNESEIVRPQVRNMIDEKFVYLNSQWDKVGASAGTWYNIGDDDVELTLTYTPEVDCIAWLCGQMLMQIQSTDYWYITRILLTSPSTDEICRFWDFSGKNSSTNFWRTHSHNLVIQLLDAGVTYVWEAEACMENAGNLFCYYQPYDTYLGIYVFASDNVGAS